MVRHAKTSAIPDGEDEDLVQPTDWNDDHVEADAVDIPYDNTESGIAATNTQAAIDELAALIAPWFGSGLSGTFVGGSNAQGGSTITVTKPVGTADGDLVLFMVSGHNVIPNAAGPAAGGGAWTERLRFDTDGNEWIAVYSKIAASEGASWTITTNNASTTLSSACAVVYRGPTTLVRSTYTDGSFTSAAVTGSASGFEIILWLSALAAGAFSISDALITQDHVFDASGSEGGYMAASRPTTTGFTQPAFTASGGGMATTWLGNLTMIWE